MKQMTSKKKQNISDLSLLFVAAVWGGGFVAVKDALSLMTPLYLMSFRFILEKNQAVSLWLHPFVRGFCYYRW